VTVGLVLPAPARCASCSTSGHHCAKCKAASESESKPAGGSCCERDAEVETSAALGLGDCLSVQTRTCGCWFSPVERTNAPGERQLSISDIFPALPAATPIVDDAARSALQATAVFGDLPPPVPHRILHCTWII
jgi:hypothetical protein